MNLLSASGLTVGTCASTPASARTHCLFWLGLALLLEFPQHLVIAEPRVFVSGCIAFTAVGPGELSDTGMTIDTRSAWNRAPHEATPLSRTNSKTWTKNGILLDRFMIIPGVPSGEPIFRQTRSSQALPIFHAKMLPNEIEELVESSIVKLFGEGGVAVETGRLRPHRYGENNGVMFDIEVTVSDGPAYRGVAGALIVSEKFYLIMFLGAEPYYYQKLLDEALEIIKGARVTNAS